MKKRKIILILTDGVSLKNFLYSDFINRFDSEFDIFVLNLTPFDIKKYNVKEIKFNNTKIHWFTDVIKTAKIFIQLNLNVRRTNDQIYNDYKFPVKFNNLKTVIKFLLFKSLIVLFNSEKGLKYIDRLINYYERKTKFYNECLLKFNEINPNFILSTSQRSIQSLSPILAGKSLKIPTACFIYSWDNLPKATLLLETNYYFVWSSFMKQELLSYYPNISNNQILVTGTPQFEKHLDNSLIIEKNKFFNKYNLDFNTKYICFSGDDVTTSPNDHLYLKDIAKLVLKLNKKGSNYGIIFRRCPVDFSGRYQNVINEYKEVIKEIEPKWIKISNSWNTIFPEKEDTNLLISIIKYSELVINVGSSMVFDFITSNKPCCYINYEIDNKEKENHYVKNLYNYVHFRSMPSRDSVFWINSIDSLEKFLLQDEIEKMMTNTKDWFKIINMHPIENASKRIFENIKQIVE